MADSIRMQIISAIESNLKKITVANGYATDAGLNVFRSLEIGPEDNLPVISLFIGQDEIQAGAYKRDMLIMPVSIQAASHYSQADTRALQCLAISLTAENLLADIRKAMGDTIPQAEAVLYLSGGVDSYPEPRAGDIAVSIVCEYQVKYSTKHNNPYE